MATPLTGTRPAASRDSAAGGDRRLRLDDILKLMVAEGLVGRAEADKLARARTRQYDHPLELIAAQHWKSPKAPHPALSLDWLVEWLAGKLGVPYRHIDPLKIDLSAVTATMSNAYAERFRILPVAVTGSKLIVATGEPFVTSWAKELGPILKLDVHLEDRAELLRPRRHERLGGRDGELVAGHRDRQDPEALGVRVRHRRGDRAQVDLERVDVLVGDAELAGQPLDQPLERQRHVGGARRAPMLRGDQLKRVLVLPGLRARDRVGVGARDEPVGDHQLQDVVEAQAPVAARGGIARGGRARAGQRRGHGCEMYTL